MNRLRLLAIMAVLSTMPVTFANGLQHVTFVVEDPGTRQPVDGMVELMSPDGRVASLRSSAFLGGKTYAFNAKDWTQEADFSSGPTVIKIPAGASLTITQKDVLPTKEIVIHVTAVRIKPKPSTGTSGTVRQAAEIKKFSSGGAGNDNSKLTKGQAGVAEDSAGQAHVRGEHAEIAYVVDGIPLPDTLSGRQGSIVVSSTIQTLEMITGGFAPEYGGQTAAILNITSLGVVKKQKTDFALSTGNYDTFSGEITTMSPIGQKASLVVDLSANGTKLAEESPQPDNQTAHNRGESQNVFGKLHLTPNSKDSFTVTVSHSPGNTQIANRDGLPDSFKSVGQGFGLFGLRNADGTRPDVNASNAGLLGASPITLMSQERAGQDINQKEVSEFATLNYRRQISKGDSAQFSLTLLHSGQDVTNRNPLLDPLNLPVDSSIEYNPTAIRNVHHVQLTGNWERHAGNHLLKIGFVNDMQSGAESYRIQAGSQLALDALAAIAPSLAPPGTASKEVDINGNPIYTATGPVPTLNIQRNGAYQALYAQDTVKSGKFTANYGLRGDWYSQRQDLGQQNISTFLLSPRINFQYSADKRTELRASYNRLFNTPPLAQGAVLGAAIQPETLSQYDLGLTYRIKENQTLTIAYFYKDIVNQVDTGLLIPGSQIGLYSAVNLARGGVHGVEISYDLAAPRSVGWDAYLHYSLSSAKPNGTDSTGADVGDFNDHDQRHTIGLGIAHTWRSGASCAATIQYGSGLASSVVDAESGRTPRTQVDLHYSTGDRLFGGKGGLSVDVTNLMDDRTVINFQSAFSGTRFMLGRQIAIQFNSHF